MKHSFTPLVDLTQGCVVCGFRGTIVWMMVTAGGPDDICLGVPVPKLIGKCQCGSAKTGLPTHSSWCPAS